MAVYLAESMVVLMADKKAAKLDHGKGGKWVHCEVAMLVCLMVAMKEQKVLK